MAGADLMWGTLLQLPILAAATQAIHFGDLHLDPIALDLGFLQIHW